jgi:dTDP-4-amino-4,6-dideoxygalactose transaminase
MYEFGTDEIEAVTRVLSTQRLFRYMDDADEVERLETEFSGKIGTEWAVATSSGTAALICGLAALGIGPGDEVLIPAYGYIADVLAVLAVGAVPVGCEVDESLTLDPLDAAKRITPRTRAIMPVHMNGFAADLDPIMKLAASHGIFVIEDACQAVGGSYRGRRLGSIGDVGAFSFNQAKLITAGEGGMLVTNNRALYERAFITHDPSSVFDGHSFDTATFSGFGFRMSEVTGGIMRAQLRRLDSIIERLRASRDLLAEALASVPGLTRIPERDPAGSCGNFLGYRLPDQEAVAALCAALTQEHVFAMPTNRFGHSFPEWELLHERRGSHHPARDPLRELPVQGPEALPASIEILGRTVVIGLHLGLSEAEIDATRRTLAGVLGHG